MLSTQKEKYIYYNHRSWVVIRILYVQQVPLKIFPGGVKNNFATVVIHPTAYDGCLELAAISLGMWTCGWSMVEAQYKAAKDHVKNHLLQDWSFKVQGLVSTPKVSIICPSYYLMFL